MGAEPRHFNPKPFNPDPNGSKIDFQAIERARIEKMRSRGAVSYTEGEPGKIRTITVQLGFTEPRGKKSTKRLQVLEAAGQVFDPNKTFALDLSDAPVALRDAVLQQAESFAGQKRQAADFSGEQRTVREMFAAVREAASLQPSQVADAPTPKREVMPTRGVTPAPAEAATVQAEKEYTPADRRANFTRTFGSLSDHVYNATKDEGTFVVEPTQGKFAAVRIKPLDNGRSVTGWAVAYVIGEGLTVTAGQEFRAKLGDMPEELRKGIRKTLEAKRSVNETDNILAQATVLRDQGREFGKDFNERLKWLSDDPAAVAVGDGHIKLQQRPDGKMVVEAVLNVPGVQEGTVYTADLSNAPQRIRAAVEAKAKAGPTVRRSAAAEVAQSADQAPAYSPVGEITDFPDGVMIPSNWHAESIDRRTKGGRLRADDADPSKH